MQPRHLVLTARRRGAAGLVESLRGVATAAGRVQGWASSLEARRRTDLALRELVAAGWQVTPDVQLRGVGTRGHLLVGPTGSYVVDSRAWSGVVTVDSKGATVTPADGPGSAWTARGQHRSLAPAAGAVVRAMTAATGTAIPAPRAVVVVWAPFPDRVAVSAGVTYVAGEHLAEWISTQPRPCEGRDPAAQLPVARPAVARMDGSLVAN
jgi:hypothetical protein